MADLRTLMLLVCDGCGQRMKIPGNAMGKTYKCVTCGAHIKVQAGNVAPLEQKGPTPPDQGAPGTPGTPAEPMGQLLVQAGAITEEQLEAALASQEAEGGRLFEILLAQKALSKDQLHDFLSKQPGVASIELSRFQIDKTLVGLIPKELALQQLALPIDRLGKLLTVAMACPLDMVTIASMEAHTGLRVKAMLCRYDEIQEAVQKVYPDEESAAGGRYVFQLPPGYGDAPATDLQQKVQTLANLPLISEQVEALRSLCTSGQTEPQALVLAVMADPLVAAAVLQAANTPLYGLSHDVDGIGLAMSLLRHEGLAAILDTVPAAPEKPAAATLRQQAVTAARIAAAIAKQNSRLGRNQAYAAGLLHGLGRLAIHTLAPDRYAPLSDHPPGPDLVAAEEKAFRTNHRAAGATIAANWRFPEALQAAIAHHGDPQAAGDHAVLAAATGLAALLACGNDDLPEEWTAPHLGVLGLSATNARKIAAEIKDD